MIDFLTNERDKVNWHDMECVVLIIMSHGETNGIYGTDGKLTKLKDMTDIFNSSQCHGLDLKPRLVFVQACRGGKCSYDYCIVAFLCLTKRFGLWCFTPLLFLLYDCIRE
jgi:hypothetical protein